MESQKIEKQTSEKTSVAAAATPTSCRKKKSEQATFLEDVKDHLDEFIHASMDEHVSCFKKTIDKMFKLSKVVAEQNAADAKGLRVLCHCKQQWQTDRISYVLWGDSIEVIATTFTDVTVKYEGYNYTSGVWQFEGNFYVITQVFDAQDEATTLQLRIIDGNLVYYNKNVIVSNIYSTWLRVNVIHDVGARKVTIFVNGEQKLEMDDHGPDTHYFKYGAYAALSGSSHFMQSRWTGIKIFRK